MKSDLDSERSMANHGWVVTFAGLGINPMMVTESDTKLGGIETFADVHNMMGVIHHDRGRLEEARDAFRKALTINPKYTEAALNLSVTCNDLGEYEQALELIETQGPDVAFLDIHMPDLSGLELKIFPAFRLQFP